MAVVYVREQGACVHKSYLQLVIQKGARELKKVPLSYVEQLVLRRCGSNMYVISYDITEDKRRNKIAKLLEGYGRRVQYSVFECHINESMTAALQKNPLHFTADVLLWKQFLPLKSRYLNSRKCGY